MPTPAADRSSSVPSSPHAQPSEVESVGEGVSEVSGRMTPWGLSLLLHLGVVMLAVFLVFAVVPEEKDDLPKDVYIRQPKATEKLSGGMEKAKPLADPLRRPSVERPKASELGGAIPTPGPTPRISDVTHWNPRPPGEVDKKTTKPGSDVLGRTDRLGPGGPGTPASPAKRVVLVIDASGSMIDTFPFVITELKKAVLGLKETQHFNIVFCRDGEAVGIFTAPRLAGEQSRAQAIDWLAPAKSNIVPRGATSPLAGIKLALAQRPDLMIVLSDNITGRGRYQLDQRMLLEEIRRLNTAGTTINTIQFLYPDPLETVGMESTMKKIAEMTGGTYRFVGADDLGL